MIKKHITNRTTGSYLTATCLGIALLSGSVEINAQDVVEDQSAPIKTEKQYSFSEVVSQSVFGDVYSKEVSENWQDLSFSNLFSKGSDTQTSRILN